MSTSKAIGVHSLSGSDPAGYQRHLLHGDDRTYVESNCYSDVIIELLHACGYEPIAAFGHLVRMDFEGDQWTFFKPPPEDLESLFGVDIHEMQPYRPLPEQIAEQLRTGRTIIVELDSWYLPDTASTSYRSEHVKSSIAAEAIDVDAQTLRYFHGAGLFELERLRIVDGLALSLDRSCLPGELAASLEGIDFTAASLYDALAERAGLVPGGRDCVLQATSADARTARLLAIPEGAPLMRVHETAVDQRGRPLECARLANRGDRWRYRTTHLAPELESSADG